VRVRLPLLAIALPAVCCGAAPAQARTLRDRVLGPPAVRGLRAAPGGTVAYATREGYSVAVASVAGFAPRPDVGAQDVAFLDSLPHGQELARLRILLAPLAQVVSACGGMAGTLACYDPSTRTMTVPGETLSALGGISTEYVIAHEYGHHVAAFRDASPFSAEDWGPRYWASYEQVCRRTLAGVLFPGDEGQLYLQNPGEAWADTYAHLTFPSADWQFADLLRPDDGAYAAARRDVLDPWTRPATRTFAGRFGRSGPSVRRFAFTLHLDGALSVALHGPDGTNYDLALSSLGHSDGRTSSPGSSDRYSKPAACRERPAETVTLAVLRRSGSGPFTVTVRYAG
jgi:hypothetical protein